MLEDVLSDFCRNPTTSFSPGHTLIDRSGLTDNMAGGAAVAERQGLTLVLFQLNLSRV